MTPDRPDTLLTFFATAAKGAETLLVDELRTLAGAADYDESTVVEERGGVSFAGPLAFGYRACLWSRFAQRVLLQLATLPLDGGADAFWSRLAALDWTAQLAPDGTLAVDFGGLGLSVGVTNSLFGAQRTKDVIVDQFRERFGRRPSVDPARPDVRVNVYVGRHEALVSLDLSGESLHRRGYREPGRQVEAPLKETLAAAILTRAGWPAVAAAGGSVVDPLCGSGTLPIEAALIAADAAPGLLRAAEAWGFTGWLGHEARVWDELVAEAGERRFAALARLRAARTLPESDGRIVPLAFGFDRDTRAVDLARADVARAGLQDLVRIERRELGALTRPPELADLGLPQAPGGPMLSQASGGPMLSDGLGGPALSDGLGGPGPGLVITNPPYGHRLGAEAGASTRTGARAGADRARPAAADTRGAGSRRERESGQGGNAAAQGPAPDPALGALYALLGERLKAEFSGWRAAILVNDLELGKRLGLRARRSNHFMNGPLHCTLLRIDINERAAVPLPKRRVIEAPAKDRMAVMEESLAPTADARAETPSEGQVASPSPGSIGQDAGPLVNVPGAPHVSPAGVATAGSPPAHSPAAEQFANRLRKNARHWGRYMRRAGATCYRVYDADLPDFAVAIDIYERWVHVQEYAPPPEIDEAKAAGRLAEAMRVVPEVLGVASGRRLPQGARPAARRRAVRPPGRSGHRARGP